MSIDQTLAVYLLPGLEAARNRIEEQINAIKAMMIPTATVTTAKQAARKNAAPAVKPMATARGSVSRGIVELLQGTNGAGLTTEEVADRMGSARQTTYAALYRLAKHKTIRRRGDKWLTKS